MKDFIPVGYMLKKIVSIPDWIKNDTVEIIYSVSGCVSKNFADYINYWKHNGYWFFNSPEIIHDLIKENNIDLDNSDSKMFYYESYKYQFDENKMKWIDYFPEESFETSIKKPSKSNFLGFDVVCFTVGNTAECSPLSCNNLAEEIKVNKYCLIETFDETKKLIDNGKFNNSEPGPFRIFAVYEV